MSNIIREPEPVVYKPHKRLKDSDDNCLCVTHVFIHFLVPSGKYLMTSNNIKLHTDCTNVWENKRDMNVFVFFVFLRQWSSVDIKRSPYKKKIKKTNILTMHFKTHYGTNEDKCFYKHYWHNTFRFSLEKQNSSKTQPALMNDQFLSCHTVNMFKLCFQFGSHI